MITPRLLALMGIPESEIAVVEDLDIGTRVITVDGVAYLHVRDDQPDAAGRSGLMYAAAPHAAYGDAFPVYQRDQEPAPADGEPAGGTTASAADDDATPPAGTAPQLLAWVGTDPVRAAQAVEAELAADKPRATLVAKLDAIARSSA